MFKARKGTNFFFFFQIGKGNPYYSPKKKQSLHGYQWHYNLEYLKYEKIERNKKEKEKRKD